MKKLLIFVVLAALLCSISIPASAASDTYELDEAGLTVSIPADYLVVTRDTPENSPIFSQWGTTKAELMTKKICLNGRSNLYEEEIVVDVTEDEENSLRLYSDSELLGRAELWIDLYQSLGYPIYKYDIYQHAQTRFIRLYYTNTDQTVHAVQYYTVYNHKQINFTFKSYEGSWSSRQETTIKTIVDSVRFADIPSNTYELDEVGITVSIPADYSVITKDTPENSPIFTKLNTTKADMMALFEENSIYLDALSPAIDEEILVAMAPNDINNMSYFNDSLLQQIAKEVADTYRLMGYEISQYEIYQKGTVKYIKFYYTQTKTNTHSLHYYTIIDNKAINIVMHSYKGSLTAQQEATVKNVIDSIQFKKAPSGTVSGEDTEPFVYTDQESGLTFTVPANWKKEAFNGDREVLDVKFASTKETGYIMLYSSGDLWSELTYAEKIGYTREDVNNSLLSKEDVAQMYAVTPDKVSTVYYSGEEYYKCEAKKTVEVSGVEITVVMTILTHIDNGWMYAFSFSGTSDKALYSDFESLVKSVKYPAVSPEEGSNVPDKEPSEPNKADTNQRLDLDLNTWQDDNQDYTVLIVLGAIFAALGVVVAVIVHRKKKKNEYEEMVEFCAELAKPQKPEEKKILCRKCGHMLPQDSVFCHFCGTKIEKES